MTTEKLKQIEKTVRTRVECEERAFRIVNKLIDGHVDHAYLIDCGQLISRDHYNDIVEERAISQLCGFPICPKSLGLVPKKRYHISTRTNKVYEISERKNFCSNQCLKASKHFKEQIPESPLWMRDKEKAPNITLLEQQNIKGLVGDAIIWTNPKNVLHNDLVELEDLDRKTVSSSNVQIYPNHSANVTNSLQTSHQVSNNRDYEAADDAQQNVCTQATGEAIKSPQKKNVWSAELNDHDNDSGDTQPNSVTDAVEELVDKFEMLNASSAVNKNVSADQTTNVISSKAQSNEMSIFDSEKHVNECKSTTDNEEQPKSATKMDQLRALLSKKKNILSKMADVQTVGEWTTSVGGNEERSNNSQAEKRDGGKAGASDTSLINESTKQESTGHTPSVTDTNTSSESKAKEINSKQERKENPLSYVSSILKSWITEQTVSYLSSSANESQDVARFSDLKVRQGYAALCKRLTTRENELEEVLNGVQGGNTPSTVSESKRPSRPAPDYKALKEETEAFQLNVMEFITGKKQKPIKKEEDSQADDGIVCLPKLDAYDQHQIRVKIVLDRLEKTLPDLLVPLHLSIQDVSSPVREVVHTCRLEKDNIVFRPGEWTLAALILLSMLGCKYPSIKSAFSGDQATHHFNTVLSRLGYSLIDLHNMALDLVGFQTQAYSNATT